MAFLARFARSRPLVFGSGLSLVKTSLCDLLVQKVVEKREEIDWRRNAAFGIFGLVYLGGVQYAIYVPLFGRIFPNAASFAAKRMRDKLRDLPGIKALFAQVSLDQVVHHPLLYFPCFYICKDFVVSDEPDPVRAVREYRTNAIDDVLALWKIWVPSTFLNFAFMPMWARIPWVASTSMIWTCVLSAMRGSSVVPSSEVVGPHVSAKTLELFNRAVVGPAPTLDPALEHLLVVAHGPDRAGVVADLTRQIYEQNAMITTSKWLKVGDHAAVVMHVACPKDRLRATQAALVTSAAAGCEDGGLDEFNVTTQHVVGKSEKEGELKRYKAHVRLTGLDRPGLLYRLTQALTDHGLNIEHLQSERHSGTGLFTANCHVASSLSSGDGRNDGSESEGGAKTDTESLKAALRHIEEELDVVCTIGRHQTEHW